MSDYMPMDPADALRRLLEGNARYVADRKQHPGLGPARRAEVAMSQQPFAVVLGCSDSRVPVELVFDQGLGDLFVIRVAGNFAGGGEVLGSIEFAVLNLGVRLVLVLGHERCGAVTAARDVITAGTTPPGHLVSVVDGILPAVRSTLDQPGDGVDNAVRANVRLAVQQLQDSQPILAPRVADGSLRVAGARYDLESGRVEVIA
jgi:carbonic anhydrase